MTPETKPAMSAAEIEKIERIYSEWQEMPFGALRGAAHQAKLIDAIPGLLAAVKERDERIALFKEGINQQDSFIACGDADDPASGKCGTCRACLLDANAELQAENDKLRTDRDHWQSEAGAFSLAEDAADEEVERLKAEVERLTGAALRYWQLRDEGFVEDAGKRIRVKGGGITSAKTDDDRQVAYAETYQDWVQMTAQITSLRQSLDSERERAEKAEVQSAAFREYLKQALNCIPEKAFQSFLDECRKEIESGDVGSGFLKRLREAEATAAEQSRYACEMVDELKRIQVENAGLEMRIAEMMSLHEEEMKAFPEFYQEAPMSKAACIAAMAESIVQVERERDEVQKAFADYMAWADVNLIRMDIYNAKIARLDAALVELERITALFPPLYSNPSLSLIERIERTLKDHLHSQEISQGAVNHHAKLANDYHEELERVKNSGVEFLRACVNFINTGDDEAFQDAMDMFGKAVCRQPPADDRKER